MASAIIHLAIAKEIAKDLNLKDDYDYYLGAIAPDIAKQIGVSRKDSHFIINTYFDAPNMKIFTEKYPDFWKNSFDLGYYIHLYTDKLWNEDFLQNYIYDTSVKLLDGTILNTSDEEILQMVYSDYTNLNTQLIDEYHLDLSLFYEDFRLPDTTITEIPIDKLDILINKMSILIENSKQEKTYLLDIFTIKQFIANAKEEIEKELRKFS
ncbi:MAG: hypothetical protein IJG68_03155 [Bacilli bacterium]|nr:hypothetical protein [Bacilli bacterium]